MDEKEQRASAWPMLLTLCLPAVYLLIIGPIVWLMHSGYLGPTNGPAVQTLETLYLPVEWLRDTNEFFGRVLVWYVELWTP